LVRVGYIRAKRVRVGWIRGLTRGREGKAEGAERG